MNCITTVLFFCSLYSFGATAPTANRSTTTSPTPRSQPSLLTKVTVNAEDLKIPDHLEGIKIERDGHLNKEFRREVILGKDHDEEIDDVNKLLTDIFHSVDSDHNNEISHEELSAWIVAKVKEHLDEAAKENIYLFTAVDRDRNGLVTWKEYHYNFMLKQGFDEKHARDHPESHKNMERKVREQILLEEAAFSETARNNPDGLNIDEFLSFRHPEHSHVTLLNMVQEIFNNLDENGDNNLTLKEFTNFQNSGSSDPDQVKRNDVAWQKERQREFEEMIDANHDGVVNQQELLFYSDPQNPAHAKSEARNLIAAADTDHSGTLSLQEVLAKKDIFLGSKMVDTAKSFHDEF